MGKIHVSPPWQEVDQTVYMYISMDIELSPYQAYNIQKTTVSIQTTMIYIHVFE